MASSARAEGSAKARRPIQFLLSVNGDDGKSARRKFEVRPPVLDRRVVVEVALEDGSQRFRAAAARQFNACGFSSLTALVVALEVRSEHGFTVLKLRPRDFLA